MPIPLGYKITETDWDEEERKVRKSQQGTETVTCLNNLLQKKTNALDILVKLEERGELKAMSITDVKQRLVGKTHSQSFSYVRFPVVYKNYLKENSLPSYFSIVFFPRLG